MARGLFCELFLQSVQRAFTLVGGRRARIELRLLLFQRGLLCLELGRAGLELGRSYIELSLGGRLHSLLVRKLLSASLQLLLAFGKRLGSVLLQIERGGCRRDPLASLLQLGGKNPQLARVHIQLTFALANAFGVRSRALDLRLAILLPLLGERDALLAFHQLLLRVLDQPAPRVEIGADLVEATGSRVDLRGATCHGLADQALPVGERLPGLLELVPLVRHSTMMPFESDRKDQY